MNQNVLNLNFEKEIGFHPSFPSNKYHCPKVLFSVCHFACSYQAIKGEMGEVKLYAAEKTVDGSIYQYSAVTEPHYFLSLNTHDCTNTNPTTLNNH